MPSPCTAFFQSLSVNSLRWRIRAEQAGNASHFRLDQVTQNALATQQNEAKGLGKSSTTVVDRVEGPVDLTQVRSSHLRC